MGAGARYERRAEGGGAGIVLMGVIRGGIICESLKPGTTLEGFDLRITRWSRYEVSEPAPSQPSVWTLIEFEAPEDESDALAQRLCKDLDSPGWYANWNTQHQAVVVFPERVFRYPRGHKAGRQKARRYGKDCGVPDSQLDWDD
jgi:hypothetical protein